MNNDLMTKIVSLCKRRGFIYPGSEIYGGLANSWDYGPLGTELKNNIKNLWWRKFVQSRDDMVGIDTALIMNPKVWEASGHLESFSDPLVECKKCHTRFRGDEIPGFEFWTKDKFKKLGDKQYGKTISFKKSPEAICPNCGAGGDNFTDPAHFNLMFRTSIGPVDDYSLVVKYWDKNTTDKEKELIKEQLKKSRVYFRPETAQGMFVNFKNILDSTRLTLPFGIAQIGKAFRNEITPGNFIFRLREFEMMEIEYFIAEKEWEKWFEYWRKQMIEWIKELGVDIKKIHEVEIPEAERAHYSKRTIDFEYEFPFGQKELYGLAYRTDFDLKSHEKFSGQNLKYKDPETGEEFVPHMIEPTWGVDRSVLVTLLEAYSEEKDRVVLKIPPKLAPYKVAVFPLLANKPQLVKKAREIYEMLKSPITQLPNYPITVAFDDRGNIGKRYYSQDEIGTILAVTVDFQTLEDKTITLRNRDTTQQIRVPIIELQETIQKIIAGEEFLKFGKLVK